MADLRTAAQQALEALTSRAGDSWTRRFARDRAIEALETALAQQVEPVQFDSAEAELLAMRRVFSEAGCTFDVNYVRRLTMSAAERDALRADAERYRWLRSARDENFWHCHEKDGYGGQILMYGVDLDAAIDAAKGGGNG